MKTKTPKPAELDYTERSIAARKEADVVEVKTINKALGEFESICARMAECTVEAANKSREIGLHFQTFSNYQQLDFMFWRNNCDGKVNCTFEQAKRHIATARKMVDQATDVKECAAFMQPLLFADNLLEETHREAVHQRSGVSDMQRFLAEVTILRRSYARALRECPMKKWTPKLAGDFVAELEWIVEQYELAKTIASRR